MNSKPIIRWTFGLNSKESMDCLKLSIKNFYKFYKDEFRYFLCFNNTNPDNFDWCKKYNIELINQNQYKKSLFIEPINNHSCWKIYPPRLDINSYEIFMDNDLVLHKKINFINFIEKNKFFMAEAVRKAYGTFQDKINYFCNLNAGLLGVPSGFDFKEKANEIILENSVSWRNSYYEEQGLVAYIFHKKKCEVISLEQIFICYDSYKLGRYGNHFVGLNNNSITKFWKFFKKSTTKML